jgi:hypothetical protein
MVVVVWLLECQGNLTIPEEFQSYEENTNVLSYINIKMVADIEVCNTFVIYPTTQQFGF